MQLILAIDADRRQADQLAALVRGRLAVELVQATSAGEGLQALAERVPDLIMTSPLLSPFDEQVLAEYLREIGPAGAHVQTLRIPVLSVAKPTGRGLFSFGRKRRPESAPDGCDPTFFADEIAVYLMRAAEERQATEASLPTDMNVSADEAPRDVPLTYVAAYEPETYTSHAASADRSEYQWKDETPIYVAPEPPVRDEEVVWEEPEPAANQQEVFAESEPVVDHQDTVAYTEPEPVAGPLDTVSYSGPVAGPLDTVAYSEPESIPEPQHAPVVVDEARPEAPSEIDEPQVAAAAKPWDVIGLSQPVAAPPIVNEAQSPVLEVSEVVVEPPPSVAPPPARPAPRRTASFEAALAAIRGAWGKTVRSEPAPTSGLFPPRVSEPPQVPADSKPSAPRQAPAAAAPPVEQPIANSEEQHVETKGPLEIDLTRDIDALEDPALVEAVGKAAGEIVSDDVEDVYELSASPALRDLESDLAAAAPPRVVPHALPVIEPPAAPEVESHERAAKGKADKSRKRSDKKEPKKPPKPNTRPVQDEWGLFDPNRCGFAAVVKKLNEVTDEDDPKAKRTSVRVISYR